MTVTIPSYLPVPLLWPHSVPALWLLYGDRFLTLSQQLLLGMLKNLWYLKVKDAAAGDVASLLS